MPIHHTSTHRPVCQTNGSCQTQPQEAPQLQQPQQLPQLQPQSYQQQPQQSPQLPQLQQAPQAYQQQPQLPQPYQQQPIVIVNNIQDYQDRGGRHHQQPYYNNYNNYNNYGCYPSACYLNPYNFSYISPIRNNPCWTPPIPYYGNSYCARPPSFCYR